MQSCYDDYQTGETWCAVDGPGGVEPVTLERTKGRSIFRDESRNLLYVDVCTNHDVTMETCLAWDQLPLFSDELDGYFWEYDNNGLKLAQFRFYEIEDTNCWP